MRAAVFGIGALCGAFLAASEVHPGVRRVRILAAIAGVLVVACALAPNLSLELVAQACTGCVSIWFVALANAALQLHTDPGMRGRVMGLWSMALPGSSPVGGLAVGFIAEAFGGRAGVATVGGILLACTVVGWGALADGLPPLVQACVIRR